MKILECLFNSSIIANSALIRSECILFFASETRDEEEIIERVSIYPNPAKDRISIESNILFSKIIVRDIHGRVIRKLKIEETDYYSIDTPFASGYYFVSIIDSFGKTISNNSLIIDRN